MEGVLQKPVRMTSWGAICLIGMVSVWITGCAAPVRRADLAGLIQSGNPPVIIDVRSGAEYRRDHVTGAVHIPFYRLGGHADELPRGDHEFAVLYCEHGPRAGMGRAFLWITGYHAVRYLEGHMKAWRADGLPMEGERLQSDGRSGE